MDKLFIDINVVLDVAVKREPFYEASRQILTAIDHKKAVGYFSAISYPTLFYLVQKERGMKESLSYIHDILNLLVVVEVNKDVLLRSLELEAADFEDSIQMICAEVCRADYIITRNVNDFKRSGIPSVTPAAYLATPKKV